MYIACTNFNIIINVKQSEIKFYTQLKRKKCNKINGKLTAY
jgi:hypothetical protein